MAFNESHRKLLHSKLERKILVPASNCKAPSSKYLNLKKKISKVRAMDQKPLAPLAKACVPLKKREKVVQEKMKKPMVKNMDEKRNQLLNKTSIGVKNPQQAAIVEFQTKMKEKSNNPTKEPKILTPHIAKYYNPKQFSSNKVDDVKKPVVNKKLSVEEIQRNLMKWRIQQEMKSSVPAPKDYSSGDYNKKNTIYTDVPKWVPVTKKYINVGTNMDRENCSDTGEDSKKVKLVDAWTNSSEIECVFLKSDFSDNHETEDNNGETSSVNMKQETNANKTFHHISIQVNLDRELAALEENKTLNDLSNTVILEKSAFKCRERKSLLRKPELKSDFDKLCKRHKVQEDTKSKLEGRTDTNAQSSSNVVFTTSYIHSESLPTSNPQIKVLQAFNPEQHKNSIYALVDHYLMKTKNNPSQELLSDEIKEHDKTSEAISVKKTKSIVSIKKYKDEHDTNIDMNKVQIGSTEDEKQAKETSTPEEVNERAKLRKKEKFKSLTLINPSKNEKMCIYINYKSQENRISKNKLTVHKESYIDIRPQLTKHTFTTANCYPVQVTSKPNVVIKDMVHLDEGGCVEITSDREDRSNKTIINEHSGTMAHKKSRLRCIIKCLIRYVKLNLCLSNRILSAVCEQLISIEEWLSNYYSNQRGSFNSLSSESRQISTLLLLEVDNPKGLNLDVSLNENLKQILQLIMESLPGSKTADAPSNQNNKSERPEELQTSVASVVLPSMSRTANYLQSRRKFRKSFGMKKNYLNKKIRSTLDKPAVNHHEPNVTENCESEVQNKYGCKESIQSADVKTDPHSEEVVYESDWATPSSSSPEESLKSHPLSNANVAKIKLRLQDLKGTLNKEHYRISINTERNNQIQCVSDVAIDGDQVGGVASNDDQVTSAERSMRIGQCTSDGKIQHEESSGKSNADESLASKSCDSVSLTADASYSHPKPSIKSRTNFTNIDKHVDGVLHSVSATDNVAECAFPYLSRLEKIVEMKENSCGDNKLLARTNAWPVLLETIPCLLNRQKQNVDKASPLVFNRQKQRAMVDNIVDKVSSLSLNSRKHTGDRVNIGVNTDVSVLDTMMRRLTSESTDDSFSRDLSLSFSTTDNELSEGEIGLYASYNRRNCHRIRIESSKCKFSSMRYKRQQNLQRSADVFLH